MALYPSLEDMKVDHMVQAQLAQPQYAPSPLQTDPHVSSSHDLGVMYPSLGDYMGLELSQELIALNMPEYMMQAQPQPLAVAVASGAPSVTSGMIAPLSGGSIALQKSFVTQSVRKIILCKDAKGKVGLKFRDINNGIFVCLVMKDSPASMAGLRFGDQILEINYEVTAGMSVDKAHKLITNASENGINLSIRDRPFERTLTLHKDSVGKIGFHFKDGKVIGLVKDSSAARNGLLIDQQLVEVNGQNVVGLKDKEISKIIDSSDSVITITIVPYIIYKHMISKLGSGLLKNAMDHTPVV